MRSLIFIIGYPTETEDDFEESLKVLAKYQFPVVHISQFYPRPGTPAARLQRLDTRIVKDRSRRATALFHSYGGDEKMTGTKLSILVTEVGADGQHFVGHDKYYRQVLVPNNPNLMGKRIDVVVTEVTKWSMVGLPVESYLNDGAAMPKLARAGKEIVVVGKDDNDENIDARRDGAVFSSGKSRDNEGPTSQGSIIDWKFFIVAGVGLLPLMMTPVRPSLKIAVLAMGTVGILCAKGYKFK